MSSRGVNKVILVGNLGKDPESRTFDDGTTVTNCTLATSERWKDKAGQEQERTEWHRLVMRDRGNYRLGQLAQQYLAKGSKLYIEGKIQTRKWQDSTGADRYTAEILVNEMQMLNRVENGGQNQQGHQTAQQPQQQPQQAPQQNMPNFDDDDIPF